MHGPYTGGQALMPVQTIRGGELIAPTVPIEGERVSATRG